MAGLERIACMKVVSWTSLAQGPHATAAWESIIRDQQQCSNQATQHSGGATTHVRPCMLNAKRSVSRWSSWHVVASDIAGGCSQATALAAGTAPPSGGAAAAPTTAAAGTDAAATTPRSLLEGVVIACLALLDQLAHAPVIFASPNAATLLTAPVHSAGATAQEAQPAADAGESAKQPGTPLPCKLQGDAVS